MYRGLSPNNHSSYGKTRMLDLLYGIKMWAKVSFVLSQFKHLTDRETDRRMDIRLMANAACIDAAR